MGNSVLLPELALWFTVLDQPVMTSDYPILYLKPMSDFREDLVVRENIGNNNFFFYFCVLGLLSDVSNCKY